VEELIPPPLRPWIPFFENVIRAVVILTIGWIVSRWVHRLTRRALSFRKFDKALGGFLASVAQYTVLVATVLSALGTVGVQTMNLTVVFGAAGLAIASAWQGTLGHLASGVLLLFFRPFDLGHKVTAAGQTGVVQDIGLFATTLLAANNEVIIVPNGEITKAPIVNFSAKGILRGTVTIDVTYGNDVPKVVALLKESLKAIEAIEREPGVDVTFNGLGARGLELQVNFWAKAEAYPAVVHLARSAIYEGLRRAEIEVPKSNLVIAPHAA
jgi:small conductance mechanosensitive channel